MMSNKTVTESNHFLVTLALWIDCSLRLSVVTGFKSTANFEAATQNASSTDGIHLPLSSMSLAATIGETISLGSKKPDAAACSNIVCDCRIARINEALTEEVSSFERVLRSDEIICT